MRISRSREQFALLHGREPTVSELAELTDSSPEDVAEAIAVNLPVVSLTGDPENGNDGQIDIAEPSPDAELVDILSLRQALGALDETDRRLIYCRYFKDMTQTRTAEVLGMSQVQVSRLERRGLKRLRESFGP